MTEPSASVSIASEFPFMGPKRVSASAPFSDAAAIVAVIGFVFASAASVHAQSADEYLQLIDSYIENPEKAARTLASWSRDAINTGVDACVRAATPTRAPGVCSVQNKITGIVLHSDVAASLINADPQLARFHIQAAGRLVEHVQDRPLFVQRWFEFIAMVYVSGGRFQNAAATVNEALREFPNSATLYMARAGVAELQVVFDHPNLRGELKERAGVETARAVPPFPPLETIEDDRTNFRVTRTLEAAAADYRRALDLDPASLMARLRIGWIHVLLRDRRADRDLALVLQESKDDSIRYLAHLFLGAIAEREKRLLEALRQYEAARQVGPFHQTACVALSHVEDALGYSVRAGETALECLALQKADDPWRRLGPFDPHILDWLQAEARGR